MEENLDSLMCAIIIIKNYCERHTTCGNCALYNEREDQCNITGKCLCPDSWDKPRKKKKTEIII